MPANARLHSIYNRSIGALALLCVSPLMAVVALALYATQGRDILYGAPRLGRHKVPFKILKFRTLDGEKARALTSDRVLPPDSNIETPLGKFLRASRLDELPQLVNIARGDMNIVGPRPVRAEIAAIEEARNPNYAIRFRVKPGLVGPTQAYMCHGTSKPIRAKFNYMQCVNPVNYVRELSLFIHVGLSVLGRASSLISRKLFPQEPLREARKTAEAWDLRIEQGNRVYDVLGFTGCGLCLADRSLNGPADLVIRTRNGGLRRAKISLQPLAFSTNPLPSHSFACETDLSAHLVARFLRDTAVVGPKPGRRARPAGQVKMPKGLRAPVG